MRTFTVSSLLITLSVCLLPSSANALGGLGPRQMVSGTIEQIIITPKQAFDQQGGTLILRATNDQRVVINLVEPLVIMSEGRLTRKSLIPADLKVGMLIRARGWRIDSETIDATLLVILNIELNPVFSTNGTVQSIDQNGITILSQDGIARSYTITNETQVNINYELYGMEAVSLIGKQALLTLNPDNSNFVRILRITGKSLLNQTQKPSTLDTNRR